MASTDIKSNNVTEMQTLFEERASRLAYLLKQVSERSDIIILLIHFSPLKDGSQIEFSWWMSRALEHVIPDHIVHGHIHDATKVKIEIGATTIWNVALPVTGSITELNL